MCEYIVRYGWYGVPYAFKMVDDEGHMVACILAGGLHLHLLLASDDSLMIAESAEVTIACSAGSPSTLDERLAEILVPMCDASGLYLSGTLVVPRLEL